MKTKYIEEAFPRWFVFGTSAPDKVDLSDGNGDVFQAISESCAKDIIDARNQYVDSLTRIFNRYPEALVQRVRNVN